MTRRWAPIIAVFVMISGMGHADPIPTPLRHQIERSRPAPIPIPMKRGESVDIQLQYFDYGTPTDLSAVQSVNFVISSGTLTNFYPARITDAVNGEVSILITPTNLWSATSYTWELPINGTEHSMIRAYGTLTVTPSIGYQDLTNTPPPMQSADFATLLLYNIGLSPWATYSWITNYVGAHGGGFVNWTDVQDKPSLYTQDQVNSLYSNLVSRIEGVSTNQAGGGGGGGGTNIIISQTSVTVTNLTVSQGGTNVTIYQAEDGSKWPTNQPFVTAFSWTNAGVNSTVTNGGLITAVINTNSGSGGLASMPATWDADSIGTNRLTINVASQEMVRVDTQGVTMVKGTIQLYEHDLECNVLMYGGNRTTPSLRFRDFPDDWGIYQRGYNGYAIGAWSVAGTEIGLLHGGGITLMNTNFAFRGSTIGDLSGSWGYPEPQFNGWKTNMSFSSLSLSNLTIGPGSLTLKDNLLVTRATLDQANGLVVRNSGGVTKSKISTDIRTYNDNGLMTTALALGLTIYDPVSGLPITILDNGYNFTMKDTSGNTLLELNPWYGLRLRNLSSYAIIGTLAYNGWSLYTPSSNLVFAVDNWTTNLVTVANLIVTNSGNIVCLGSNNTNLFAVTGATGAVKVRGQDSDTRYALAPSGFTGRVLTNIVGNVTSRWFFSSQGLVTNWLSP